MCASYEGSGAPLLTCTLRNVKKNEVAPGQKSLPCLTSSSKEQINVYGELLLNIADLCHENIALLPGRSPLSGL